MTHFLASEEDWAIDYKEIYYSDIKDAHYAVFVMTTNTAQKIYILTPLPKHSVTVE